MYVPTCFIDEAVLIEMEKAAEAKAKEAQAQSSLPAATTGNK